MDTYLSNIIFFVQICLYIIAMVVCAFWTLFKLLKMLESTVAKFILDEGTEKIVQAKALNLYAFLRAVILISVTAMIVYITTYNKNHNIEHIWLFPSVLLIVYVVQFYVYLIIVNPLFEVGKQLFEVGKQREESVKYILSVNSYRRDMNVVFTILFLTTLMIAIISFLLPVEFDKGVVGITKWLTIPSFASGVIYLISTEKKLEDIYGVYFPNEYYESKIIRLL